MADRHITYRLRAFLQGGRVAVGQEVELLTSFNGVVSGATDAETALQRIDGTGIGSAIFTFTGSYTAQGSNIGEWFGNRQQTRLRCTDNGGTSPVIFRLPGETALDTAFDALVTAGLPETIRFVLEYTGPSTTFMSVVPRDDLSPQIGGISSITIRPNIAATVEIQRTSGTIGSYIFQSIGGIGDVSGGTLDSLKLISPTSQIWDASENGTLPTTGVVKGNAYKVVSAPANGTGRFGEVMQDDDWVVWEGDTFTSWSATPHLWFVLPAHEVRRITALEKDFLTDVQTSIPGSRNSVIRGADYSDSAGEIRMKLYTTVNDYSAADLNTTGDIDEYTDPSGKTGILAIRLSGVQATLAPILPTLYVYSEDSTGEFRRLLNLADDFTHQGNFGAESDYTSNNNIVYTANDTLRIYFGTVQDRYNIPALDISRENLDDNLQSIIDNSSGGQNVNNQRLAALENKVDVLYPLSTNVSDLNSWASIYEPESTVQSVDITSGYSLLLDYRSDASRYESSGVTYDASGTNVIRYTGLSENVHRSFGFKVAAPADKVLMWLIDGAETIPFIDMTAAGNFRINNYTPARSQDQTITNQAHFLSRTSGDAVVTTNTNSQSTFTVTNFPSGATGTARSMQIEIDVYLNSANTNAGHFADITLPTTNIAQVKQTINANINLGPLHGNRTVNVTVGYELRVSGSDLLIDFTLENAPADVSISFTNVVIYLSYTTPTVIARVDNYSIFQDGFGDYTFTGENELLVTFQPHVTDNNLNAVGAVINSTGSTTEFNDLITPTPEHQFSSIEIPDDIEFRSFVSSGFLRHSDLSHLLTQSSTQWTYGLALLRSVTEQVVNEAIDFTAGIVLVSPNGSRYQVSVANDGTLSTTLLT